MIHISPGGYIPTMADSSGKYRGIIDSLRGGENESMIRVLETRAMIINQILGVDPNADFFITCIGNERDWRVDFRRNPQQKENLGYLEKSLQLGKLLLSFPESGK